MNALEAEELKRLGEFGELWTWIFLAIGLAISSRIVAGIFDKNRIVAEIENKGGVVESIRWTPFAKGWLGSKNERLYRVMWIDRREVRHTATVKTAMFAGNYFADSVTAAGTPGPAAAGDTSDLVAENQRLQRANENLRRELEQFRKDQM